jgi:nitroreductase
MTMTMATQDLLPQLDEQDADFLEGMTTELITSRQSILPKRLVEPGPSAAQVDAMLRAAAAAPDHGAIRPWRFIIVPTDKRALLADVFAAALLARDGQASADQLEMAREKAYRAPFLMLVVARLSGDDSDIAPLERMVSVGCAVQNMLLTAHSAGLGSSLTSGKALQSDSLRGLFGLRPGEEAICFLNVGTVARRKSRRCHPDPASFVSTL